MAERPDTGEWIGGLAEWTAGQTAYLSVAFTWKIGEAFSRAAWYRALGYRVVAGGPALFLPRLRAMLADVAEVGNDHPDALAYHNPAATIASRGCPVGCHFCIVPAMEGRSFTLLPDFPVRPVLCDNNLSALPSEFQDYIISRYQREGVPLLDANSGFEPQTFDDQCYARWRVINKGPWRFAFDEQCEREPVERVLKMLLGVTAKRKRVYTLIGNEPIASCLDRIHTVLGGPAPRPRAQAEPHVQWMMKLNALEKRPHVRFDWTETTLRDMARWANRRIWRYASWEEYRRSAHTSRDAERFDARQGLFL